MPDEMTPRDEGKRERRLARKVARAQLRELRADRAATKASASLDRCIDVLVRGLDDPLTGRSERRKTAEILWKIARELEAKEQQGPAAAVQVNVTSGGEDGPTLSAQWWDGALKKVADLMEGGDDEDQVQDRG